MTTSELPSDLLRRAADLINLRARDVLAKDWAWDEDIYRVVSRAHAGEVAICSTDLTEGRWIAMMNPLLAAPLVAWLRKAADDYKSRERLPKLGDPNPYGAPVDLTGSGLFGPSYWETALEFARLILGVSAEGKERSNPWKKTR